MDQIVSSLTRALQDLELDATIRNDKIDKRFRYLYQDGLWEDLQIADGFDRTLYNFLPRVVEIHTSQVMGRGFSVYSYYNKEDVTLASDPEEQKLAELRNQRRKADADARKRAVDAIIRDNGGMATFKHAAKVGSWSGFTLFKSWFDKDEKKWRIISIESPQNYRAGWSDNNFRERDYDAYVYQLSLSKAMQVYGSKLKEGQQFKESKFGEPFMDMSQTVQTDNPINQDTRKYTTVIDFTGFLDGYKASGNKVVPCEPGEETKVSLLVVGGVLVQTITDPDLMPRYYMIQNKLIPGRPWGESDLPESALEINATYLERMSDFITIANKVLFPKYKAKGFEAGTIPKPKQRQVSMIPMAIEQDVQLIETPTSFGIDYPRILEELKESFVKITGIGRVLFDDPTINPNSNQALMTTLKGVIDIVEDKHSRWEPVLVQMFEDALRTSAKFIPEMKDFVETGEDWYFSIEWPSVLRREDATYQQMWLNRFINNTVSLETYLEKMGDDDTSEEVDRIKDEMRDPVTAAILAKQLPLVATNLISPPTPQAPQTKYNVNVKADATLNPADNAGVINEVMGAAEYQTDQTATVAQNPNPTLTPDQNQPGQQSFAGSGQAQPVSPEGAIAQVNQRSGA